MIFSAILTFGYVRYVRPHMVKSEDEEMMLDENDVTQNLLLIPGEEIFFHSEEPHTSSMWEVLLCGCGNRVHKLGVTTKRIVAQKRESTAFGTCQVSFFFFTLVTGPRRSLSLELSDTRVYEPQIRARLVTTTHFYVMVVLQCSPPPSHQPAVGTGQLPLS